MYWWRQWRGLLTDNPTYHLLGWRLLLFIPLTVVLGSITPSPTLGDACLTPPFLDDGVSLFRVIWTMALGSFRVFGVVVGS